MINQYIDEDGIIDYKKIEELDENTFNALWEEARELYQKNKSYVCAIKQYHAIKYYQRVAEYCMRLHDSRK